MNSRIRSVALFSLLAWAALGCGSRTISPPKTASVKGTVTMNGSPAMGVVVKFHPQFDIGAIKYIPYGETDKAGRFVLSTGAAGNGAPPGEYVVTFEKPRTESDWQNSGVEVEVDELEGRFSDPARSHWKVTIAAGDNELEPFRLD